MKHLISTLDVNNLMLLECKYVLGIDAAWTSKGSSGIALLKCLPDSLPELVRAGRSYEEFCYGKIDWVKTPQGTLPNFKDIFYSVNEKVDIVALDIPLSPKPISGRRNSDNIISHKYGKFGASAHTPSINRPGQISTSIYEQLIKHGYTWSFKHTVLQTFIEIYPHTAILELFNFNYRFEYKVSKRTRYWPNLTPEIRKKNIVGKLLELKEKLKSEVNNLDDFLINIDIQSSFKILKSYEDLIDSIISALVGYYYLKCEVTPYGDNESTIWVPKKSISS